MHAKQVFEQYTPSGAQETAKNSGFWVKLTEGIHPRLKPTLMPLAYAGVETPASLRIEFFRSPSRRALSQPRVLLPHLLLGFLLDDFQLDDQLDVVAHQG